MIEKVYCAVLDTKYEQLGEYWLEECFGQSQCREYISLEFKEWEDIFSPSGVVSCNGETAQQYANDFFDHHFDPSYFDFKLDY